MLDPGKHEAVVEINEQYFEIQSCHVLSAFILDTSINLYTWVFILLKDGFAA
jgi:hypothetical protein